VIRGLRQLESILPALDRFHREVGAPITSRWSWMSSWFQLHPEVDVECVLVRSPSGGIEGAALLARHRVGQKIRLFTVDNQTANIASVFARSDESAEILAKGIADLALSTNGEWELELSQIAGSNSVIEALSRHLPTVTMADQLSVPQVLITPEVKIETLLSKNMRKQLRRGHNRLVAQTTGWKVDFHRGTESIMALLPEVEAIHIARDHDQRNQSDLDDALDRRFWQETVVTHTYTDELELATLTINDTIAAYVISFIDGTAYRVLDGRMNSDFAEFSPGRILETALLERAIADDAMETFDWMTGVAPETILASNFWQPRTMLRATSADTPTVKSTERRILRSALANA
jgi:CelD/BcsL family acetyltransferase involved in cellulose biosynthesis